MNAKTLADFRVGHGAALEDLLIDSFAGLVMAGVASLDRVAQDGVRVRASAGAASFRRHSTLEDCREEAAQAVRRLQEEASRDPCAASRREAAARLRAARDRERRVEKAADAHARIAWPATRPGATPRGAGVPGKTKAVSGGGKRTGKGKGTTPGEGTPRLDYGPRGASDEDGRWRIPAGLQRAVRLRYAKRRGLLASLSTTTVQTWARWRR